MVCNLSIAVHKLNPPNGYECALDTKLQRTPQCLTPGSVSETIELVLGLAQVPFTIQSVPGSNADTINLVEAGEFDTLLIGVTPNKNRLDRFNFSVPVPSFEEELMLLFADNSKLKYVERALGFMQVYDLPTWMILGLVVFVHKFYNYMKKNNKKTDIRDYIAPNSVVWTGFFMMIMTALYRNGLLARLFTVHRDLMINNLNELVDQLESGNAILVMQQDPPWASILDVAHDKSTGVLRLQKEISNGKTINLETFGQFAQFEVDCRRGTHVLLSYGFVLKDLATKWCGVTVLPLHELDKIENGILFGSTVPSDLIEKVNEVILTNVDLWLSVQRRYSLIMDDLQRQKQENCTGYDESFVINSLGVIQMSGIFLVLILGSGLACCILLIERVMKTLENLHALIV